LPLQEVYGPGAAPLVSSYAIDDGGRLLFFDPLAVPSETEAGREPVIVGAALANDRLLVGVEAFSGKEPNDVVLWGGEPPGGQRRRHARRLRQGFEIPIVWLPKGVTRERIAEGLHPLLALPVLCLRPRRSARPRARSPDVETRLAAG